MLPPLSTGRGRGTDAAFPFPSVGKGTDPSSERISPPVPFNRILKSECGKEQRLTGKVGDTSKGRTAAHAENQGAGNPI